MSRSHHSWRQALTERVAINDPDNNIVTIPDGIPGVACGMVIS